MGKRAYHLPNIEYWSARQKRLPAFACCAYRDWASKGAAVRMVAVVEIVKKTQL